MLAWMLEEKDIEPHVPTRHKTERKNDSFSSNDFRWYEEAEGYRCQAYPEIGSRLRGMSGATDEFTLAAAVQNSRRLAKFTSQGPQSRSAQQLG